MEAISFIAPLSIKQLNIQDQNELDKQQYIVLTEEYPSNIYLTKISPTLKDDILNVSGNNLFFIDNKFSKKGNSLEYPEIIKHLQSRLFPQSDSPIKNSLEKGAPPRMVPSSNCPAASASTADATATPLLHRRRSHHPPLLHRRRSHHPLASTSATTTPPSPPPPPQPPPPSPPPPPLQHHILL